MVRLFVANLHNHIERFSVLIYSVQHQWALSAVWFPFFFSCLLLAFPPIPHNLCLNCHNLTIRLTYLAVPPVQVKRKNRGCQVRTPNFQLPSPIDSKFLSPR